MARDYVRVLWQPSDVFARHAGTGVLKPYLIVTAVFAVQVAVGLPLMLRHGLLEPSELDVPDVVLGPLAMVLVPLAVAMIFVLDGVFIWVGTRMLRGRLRWRQAFVVALFSTAPLLLPLTLVAGILLAIVGPASADISLSLRDLLPADRREGVVGAIASRIGVMQLWISVLYALAARAVAGVRQPLTTAVAVFWGLDVVRGLIAHALPDPSSARD